MNYDDMSFEEKREEMVKMGILKPRPIYKPKPSKIDDLKELERKINLLDYKDYKDFKQKTGLQGIDAVEFLLNELKKLRKT